MFQDEKPSNSLESSSKISELNFMHSVANLEYLEGYQMNLEKRISEIE